MLACFKGKISTRALKKYQLQAHSWSWNTLLHVSGEVWSMVECCENNGPKTTMIGHSQAGWGSCCRNGSYDAVGTVL